MAEPERIPPKQRLTGEELAAAMVEQMVIQNARIEAQIQVMAEQNSLLDTLCGHFDVVHLAMDNLTELAKEGKIKLTIADFAKCWVDAADEILPEEEEEDDGGILRR
jgi:hypothetical protein